MNLDAGRAVLVHGLWFGPWSMAALSRRLVRRGFAPRSFGYSTLHRSLETTAARLAGVCRARAERPVHLVGHSMGGLVILNMLCRDGDAADGRVVLLGTPLDGSSVARRVAGWPGANRLLGRAAGPLTQGHGQWPEGREIGMIAGTAPFGLGVFAGGIGRPHDGTVTVAETRHAGLTDHRELPVTHTGMLYSRVVADQVAHFLRHGRFGNA